MIQQKIVETVVEVIQKCHHTEEEKVRLRKAVAHPTQKFREYIQDTVKDISDLRTFKFVRCDTDEATKDVLRKLQLKFAETA